jgi:hypothetical protein
VSKKINLPVRRILGNCKVYHFFASGTCYVRPGPSGPVSGGGGWMNVCVENPRTKVPHPPPAQKITIHNA